MQGLHLDWRLGAEWFACLLGDHDESLNLLSWQYNSGEGSTAVGSSAPALTLGRVGYCPCWACAVGDGWLPLLPALLAAQRRLAPYQLAVLPLPACQYVSPPQLSRVALFLLPSQMAGIGTDPRGRVFHTISQGLRYDPEARLIASWVPELAGLAPDAMHQPWAAPPEALTAAGVCLGEAPVAAGEEQAAVAASSARVSWYPLPVVDPATQIAKGPRKKQPRGGGAPAAPS